MENHNNVCERCEVGEQQIAPWQHQIHAPEAHPRMVARRRWWRSPWRGAAVLTLGLYLVTPPHAHAATFACGAGDVACLRTAITTANANGQTNTIRLAAGTYTLTAVDNETDGPNGLPSITSPLTLEGAGADTTILVRAATAPGFRLLHVAASGTLTLAQVTLRGGGCDLTGGCGFDGGGLFNSAGTVTLTQSTVAANHAVEGGGGLFNSAGTVALTQSTIAANSSLSGAGGLDSTGGTVTLTQSTVDGNNSGFSVGGLSQDQGTLRITQSRITENIAGTGTVGGLFVGGTVTLTQSTIAGNAASNTGGMFIGATGVARLVAATVVDNVGQDGAGITNSGQLHLTNSTVARNDSAFGSGLVNFGSTVMLNATIADNGDNSNTVGIGVSRGTVTLQNTIVARNTVDCSRVLPPFGTPPGRIISLGNNLIGDPEQCPITLQATDRTGDPGLDAFTDDGTPGNGHVPLLPTSQAINVGTDAVCPPTDQLGQPRGGGCDMGAIEFQAPRVLVNDFVAFAPSRATFRFLPDPTGCPEGVVGTFRFEARLANSSERALTDLVVVVTTLTNGNLLHNADGGPAGVGAQLTVPQQDGFSDGVLSPEEFVDVPFLICLQEHSPFRFFMDVFGEEE